MAGSRAGITLFDTLIDTLRVISRTLSAGFERFWDRAPSTAARRSTDPVQEFVAYIKRAGPRRQCGGARLGLLWFDLVLNARHAWRHGSGPPTAWSCRWGR